MVFGDQRLHFETSVAEPLPVAFSPVTLPPALHLKLPASLLLLIQLPKFGRNVRRIIYLLVWRHLPTDRNQGHMHDTLVVRRQQLEQTCLCRLGHRQREDGRKRLMDERRRRHKKRWVSIRVRLGQCLQVRHEHGGGRVEPQIWNRKVFEDVRVAVLPELAVVDASSVVDDYFRSSQLGDGFLEGSRESGLVGHVRDVLVYGGGGGIRGNEFCIAGQVGFGAGE